MNLEQLYCERHKCDRARFQRALFWRSLYPHALPLAILLGGARNSFFSRDQEFISFAGRSETLAALREEVREFRGVPENVRWTRRFLRIRISTTRFQRIAAVYFTSAGAESAATPSDPLPSAN